MPTFALGWRAWMCALFCLLFLIAWVPAPARAMPDVKADHLVIGLWEPPAMDAVIAIDRCGETLCAKLIRHEYEDHTLTDIYNPDPALRARPLAGLRIIEGLRAAKRGKWNGGTFYDPRTGKTYFSRLKFLDERRIKIVGCIAPGLCKGYVWTRINE